MVCRCSVTTLFFFLNYAGHLIATDYGVYIEQRVQSLKDEKQTNII